MGEGWPHVIRVGESQLEQGGHVVGLCNRKGKKKGHACTWSYERAKTVVGVLLQASKLGLVALGQAAGGPRLRLKLGLLFD